MTLRTRPVALIAVLFGLLLAGSPQTRAQTAAPNEPDKVVDTVKAVFEAGKADDLDKFHAVTTRGFYIFDMGTRFEGDAIMTLLKADHAAGKKYDWNVTDPDVHIIGSSAWVAYTNKGSVTDASGTQEMQWLESAFLQKQGDQWKISFMQSTRVPQH